MTHQLCPDLRPTPESINSRSNMSDPFYVLERIEKSNKPVQMQAKKKIKNSSVKKKAKDLLTKEKLNTTKSRLECLLVQQFQGKYGSRQPNSQLNKFIKNAVHKFIQSHDEIGTDRGLLNTLEKQVCEQTEQYKADIAKRNGSTSRVQDALQLSSKHKNSSVESIGESLIGSEPTAGHSIDPHQWSVINAIQAATVEEAALKEKRMAEKKKLKFRQELDEQLSEVEARKRNLIEEKRKIRMETEE